MSKAPRRMFRGGGFSIRLGAFLVGGALVTTACSEERSATELEPEGPPRVKQVFVQEKVTSGATVREKFQLAYGDHPDIPLPDEDPANGDDREVVSAVAHGTARLRVVLDELVRGNDIEEIACADGTYSVVPPDADPDDIAKCSGPVESLTECTAVCVGASGPVGILDENEDGASDDTRMREYAPGELAVGLVCGGVNIPLSREASYYNPSGNQLLPAVPPPNNILGLGPALMLVPAEGMRTGSECTVTFRPEVQDKDGNQVCAPPRDNLDADCNPGDTSAISFTVEPLSLFGSDPADGATGVALTAAGSADATMLLQFVARIDAASLSALELTTAGTPVTIEPTVLVDDPTLVTVRVPGGFTANTDYTLTIGTGLTDIFGGALPQEITISFTTGEGTAPTPDAGTPDALL